MRLAFNVEHGGFSVWYYDERFPIRPRDYAAIIRRGLSESGLAAGDKSAEELERFAGEFATFAATSRSKIRRGEARRRAERLKLELARLAHEDERAKRLLETGAELYNGKPGSPETFVRLHNLLERQFYRVSYWRAAADEINYRRFFEINDLAGIRPENPRLFADMHRLVVQLIGSGCVHGLRLDHIDGLFDPAAYCLALEALAKRVAPAHSNDELVSAPSPRSSLFYIVVEKILARHERLREAWAVQGTSGYDFLNLLNGLFVSSDSAARLSRAYARFAARLHDFDTIVYACKKHVIDTALAGELAVLANQLDRISEEDWRVRDFTRFRLRDALKEIVACFPVYRTYVSEAGITPEDERDIDWAVAQAKKRWTASDPEIFDFIREVLLVRWHTPLSVPRRADLLRFAMSFQQYTGPVTAKALEDTAFYRYHRLISLNEVGGDPRQFGVSVAAFHRANEERARHWPHAMLATATHDTKRGEDTRLRIDVLSELAESWSDRVAKWSVLNRSRRTEIGGLRVPSRNDEYLIYQTLLGVWPAEWTGMKPEPGDALEALKDRLRQYTIKALREAKLRSSWARPNEEFENGYTAFVGDLVDTARPNLFLDDFLPFQARLAFFGRLNSLSHTALKLTCPGIPDIYRGCELWDLSLVDPDNRRPVDFELRMQFLRQATGHVDWEKLMSEWKDGQIKLAIIHRLLMLRRAMPDVFDIGGYVPLEIQGDHADHAVAFMRRNGDSFVIVAAGRLFARLWGDGEARYDGGRRWADTWVQIEAGAGCPWRDAISGNEVDVGSDGRVSIASLFAYVPAVVLTHGTPP